MGIQLTCDVEEYFHVENFRSRFPRSTWDAQPSRVVAQTKTFLDLCARHNQKALFFVLGWVAQRNPALVKEIHEAGHEIGSHGFNHELIYQQTPKEFEEDIASSIHLLEDLTGAPVTSYRAPCFSITEKTPWAFEVLAQQGIERDYSVFPIHHDRYGIPTAPRFPYGFTIQGRTLTEFPMTTVECCGRRIPFSGGGYFRLLPLSVITFFAESLLKKDHPLILYFHPWEFDPQQPRIKTSYLSMFRHYINIDKNEKKLDAFLTGFDKKGYL